MDCSAQPRSARPPRSPRARLAPALLSQLRRRRPRRRDRGGRAPRTTPGTRARRPGCEDGCAAGRPSPAAVSTRARPRVQAARSPPTAAGRFAAPGADEMEAEVAVPELEPGLATEEPDRLARVPRLVRPPPPALLVAQPGQRVEQCVEVRRDVEAVDLDVVADICDHGHVTALDDLRQRLHEAGAADPACQYGKLHLAPERRLSSAARVFGPTRGSSWSRSSRVSTSSVKFGISTSRDGASARKRDALPGP